jgi:peptidoglycan/LPS O-acetylase OafA/YrhL
MVLLAKIDAIRVPQWSLWWGEISYSLYLVHLSVFVALAHVATAIPQEVVLLSRPVIAVICAWALFRYVESPLSTWARRRLLSLCVPWSAPAKRMA